MSDSKHRWNSEEENVAERAVVLVPDFRNAKSQYSGTGDQAETGNSQGLQLERSLASRVEEATGLARAIA